MKKFWKNQAGVSLVELIIAMSLMAVLTTSIALGTGLLTGKRINGGAQQLCISLQSARTHALGKGDGAVSAVLRRDAEGNVVLEENVDGAVSRVIIGKKDVDISYQLKGSTTEVILPVTDSMVFRFDRSSGAIKPNADGSIYTSVIVSKGTKRCVIDIANLTGRISMRQ